ncbi:uncharacterized protein At4g26450-like [Olea europaea var. sylvestris]|uniref:uncharacterized protein At4g26450-like n=1 Tax=Olea europaea var. sylvestris TaxID=158386 RepID=UPI000C1D4056|nr:uncharacterized protein At4g26450-like [Olea europaea var. sylvestris]XP_022855904.1 uncharacterized protein At4g26450-like [Olea europaea var. sylvestris]XP_022855905.1 uncharacterized protein At4g26450-like [Olea europaea var. sylvestris]
MYARRRSGGLGNGYRPNVMGMGGVVAASRISPEGSLRGHQMYNSEYRNYNRSGYGRGGHSKPFQPPLPPPCETDIFMEAGKLAAEYLVTKGILPPNALSGKWQNVDWKNQMEDFMQISMDSRGSVHSRLGTAAADVGPGWRRYSDEYNFMGSRNSMRGRRRTGSSNNHGSNWNPEFVRSGSWFDRGRTSPGREADRDISAELQDEQSVQKDSDTGMQSSSAGEITQESDNAADLQSSLEKCNLPHDAGAKPGSSSNENDVPSNDDVETPIKESDGNSTMSNEEAEEDKEGRNDNDLEQKHAENMKVSASLQDGSLASENNIDLMRYCKFANVPTKTRSSLAIRGSKVDVDTIAEDETMSDSKLFKDSGVQVIDVPVDGSALNASCHRSHKPNSLSDVLKAPSTEEDLGVSHTSRQGHCSIPGSFPKRSMINHQEIDGEFPGYGSSNPIVLGRGEKRPLDDDIDCREETKRPKEWAPPLETQPEGCLPLSNSMENQHTSVEPSSSQSEHVTLSTDQQSSDISLFSRSHIESSEYTEEKQLFPGSFKTCDLNLIEASDMNENRAPDPILMFRSITETGRQAAPVDFDLSMSSNNSNVHNKHGKREVDDKDIEVIDLEDDSMQEDNTFTNAERRADSVFNVLDNFPDNVHNATEIPNHQDGYGLMISELLGSDSVTTDLSALHNDMDLHNGQGILGDDDSIYMSFGEIPISFIRPWEQPTQDYGKPF